MIPFDRRSSLWRGAWIETRSGPGSEWWSSLLVAPLYGEGRGLKHLYSSARRQGIEGRSSLWRGAWIETLMATYTTRKTAVAPLYGEGRGLKLRSAQRSKTLRTTSVAPLYGEGRGLKPWLLDESAHREQSLLSMERGVD